MEAHIIVLMFRFSQYNLFYFFVLWINQGTFLFSHIVFLYSRIVRMILIQSIF